MLKHMIAGMQILAKYDEGAEISAQHDEFYVCGPSPGDMKEEDSSQLEELGWHWDGDGAWRKFT